MIFKERGRGEALLIWAGTFAFPLLLGGVVHRVLEALGL